MQQKTHMTDNVVINVLSILIPDTLNNKNRQVLKYDSRSQK